MFENIIGQREVVGRLSGELAEGRFPRSSLFFGPLYSAKLSTALETARVLTCRAGNGQWSCDCRACRLQKELAHPHTVLMGPRSSDVEIAACAGALVRSRTTPTLYLFLRAVRKLTRRFDIAVLDADDPRMKGVPERVARMEELLAELPLGDPLPPERALGELLEQITAAAVQLSAQARAEGITIGQVRRLAAWAHLSAADSRKVAIIENADRMQDGARNALLKLLEEPPESVSLLLLSTRRAAIIPTILSRLRPYAFTPRSAAEEQEVMRKIFREDAPGFDSLRGFFLAWKEINPEKLSILSRRFMELVHRSENGSVDIVAELSELFPDRRGQKGRFPKDACSSFLEELTSRFREAQREGRARVDTLEEWLTAVREAFLRLDVYNMNPQTVVETLFYRMRDAAAR